VLFLFFGPYLHKKLSDLGIKEILGIGFGDLQTTNDNTKDVASKVSSIETSLTDLETQSTNESNPADVKWKAEITALKEQATAADSSLKTTLLSQQALLQGAAQKVDTSGWIYAGQIDAAMKKWSGIGAKNISPVPATPDFQPNQTFTLSSDVFLHKTAPSGSWHNQADVSAVLKQGTKIQVVGKDTSAAKSGGYFLWLQVKQVS
jgi:hypothetical protein